jgi:hypothetical protein
MTQPYSLPSNTAESDARNRAALYMRDAASHADHVEQGLAAQRQSDFQQIIWLRDLDYRQANDQRTAEHKHAIELEDRKRLAAMELRKLELEQGQLRGNPARRESSFWSSKLFLVVLTISLPLIIPALIRALSRPPAPVSRTPKYFRRRRYFRRKPSRSFKNRKRHYRSRFRLRK